MMAANAITKNPGPKKYFGAPLLKSNNSSPKPEVESKIERIQETRDTMPSKMESSEKGNYVDSDTSYVTQTTFDIKSIESMNMQEMPFSLETDINEADQSYKKSTSITSTSQKENTKEKHSYLKNEPKKPVTPFIRWSICERDNVKKEIGTVSVTEMGQELRKRWAALSSDMKQIYQDKYDEENEIYEKSGLNSNAITLEEDNMKGSPSMKTEIKIKKKFLTSKKSESKKIKDPCAPKKPPSAYLLWSKTQREKIKDELGNLSMVDIGKELGKRWKSEASEVKDFYERKYKEKKEMYLKDITNYKLCESANVKLREKVQMKDSIEDSMDSEVHLDCLQNTDAGQKESIYKNVLRPKKKGHNDFGENRFFGSSMVKPYFKFVSENWRDSAKMTENIIPDAGPLDVIDCLNQMWSEREDIVEKYTKPISKKQKK